MNPDYDFMGMDLDDPFRPDTAPFCEELVTRAGLSFLWEQGGLCVVQRIDGMYGLIEIGNRSLGTVWAVLPYLDGAYLSDKKGYLLIKKPETFGMSWGGVQGRDTEDRFKRALAMITGWKINIWGAV